MMANFSMGFIVFLLLSLASQSQAVESSSVVKNESQDDLRGLEQTSSPAPSSSPSPSSYVSTSSPGPYQPRVLPVELKPRRAFGTIVAQSSIWCDGAQMVWPIGHQADDERPYCRNGDSFSPSPKVITDKNDRLNARDTNRIDRHQCETMDVNRDGRNDLICVVGADKGTGYGYNELYFTKPDGSLQKVFRHGLYKYPSMRARLVVVLKGRNTEFVFITSTGNRRDDGKPNQSRMFRNVFQTYAKRPYFVEQHGPWIKYDGEATCAVAADINGDGLDDLIVCKPGKVAIYMQRLNGSWYELPVPQIANTWNWGNVRADKIVGGDNLVDLVVVSNSKTFPKVWVFKGQSSPPYFRFRSPVLQATLPHSAPDVEVLDVDGDGNKDIYFLQTDVTKPGYCWGYGVEWFGVTPPDDFVPPRDAANDWLFVGQANDTFLRVAMQHSLPGCGATVKKIDDQTMALTQSKTMHPGFNYVLQW